MAEENLSKDKAPYEPFPEPRSPAEMDSLSHDDAIRLVAQRQEAGSRASLVEALMRMGRWDEALAIEVDDVNLAFIQALKSGEERDDAERCGCIHEVDVTDYVRYGQVLEAEKDLPEGEKTAKIELRQHPNYTRTFRYWSSTHNGMIWASVCCKCGDVQSVLGEIDDLHAGHAATQARAAKIEYAKPGARVRVL